MSTIYLLDTHALHFWITREAMSQPLIEHLNTESEHGNVLVSSVSFWEIGLLCRSGRMELADPVRWAQDVLANAPLKLLAPSVTEMVESTLLPKIHRDPFDRLLIAQTRAIKGVLITRDKLIRKYPVRTFWT